MTISYQEFLFLRSLIEPSIYNDNIDHHRIEKLSNEGYIYNGKLTEKGIEYLNAHRVDNAIILAAGYGSRFEPLSHYIPKGLVRIKGEVLIERLIRQLNEKKIKNVIVVVGYMAEKFDYLKEKYGVQLIYNQDYRTCNNISSIYYARDYLKNTYILGCDNWYSQNIFNKYEYDSYYSRLYSKGFVDEYCVELDSDDYILSIKKGGRESWYTIGEIYFSEDLSMQIKNDLINEYSAPEVREMIIDIFCQRHIDKYRFHTKERQQRTIFEFDTMREAEMFDSSFPAFIEETINGIGKEPNTDVEM